MQLNKQKKTNMDGIIDLFNSIFVNKNQDADGVIASNIPAHEGENLRESAHLDSGEGIELDLDSLSLFDDVTGTVTCERASDGLIHSLNRYGKVDVEYIAEITGKTVREVVSELQGAIFQNPEKFHGGLTEGWETADEYLSGNLGEKLRVAIDYNHTYPGYFNGNVAALKSVLPQGVDLSEIHVTIGTPWIPVEIMEQFINYLLGLKG